MQYTNLLVENQADSSLPAIRQHIIQFCTYSEAKNYLKEIYNHAEHGNRLKFEEAILNTELLQQMVLRDFPFNYRTCRYNEPEYDLSGSKRVYWKMTYEELLNKAYNKLTPEVEFLFLHISSGNVEALQKGFSANFKQVGLKEVLKLKLLFEFDNFITDTSLGYKPALNPLQLCVHKNQQQLLNFFYELTKSLPDRKPDNLVGDAVKFGQFEAFTNLVVQLPSPAQFMQEHGMRLLTLAATYKHIEVMNHILRYYFQTLTPDKVYSPLHAAAREGHFEVAEILIGYGFMPNFLPNDQPAALYYAAQNNYPDIVDLLLKNGADPNLTCIIKGNKHANALRIACELGHLEIVEKLLMHEALINQVYIGETTALSNAVQYSKLQVVEKLIEYKANVDYANSMQQTPVFIAIRNNDLPMVKCLLEAGANPTQADINKQQPADYARFLSYNGISQYITKFIEYKKLTQTTEHQFIQIRNMFAQYSDNFWKNPNPTHGKEVKELLAQNKYIFRDCKAIPDLGEILLEFYQELRQKLENKKIKADGSLAALFSVIKSTTGIDYFNLPHPPEFEPPEEAQTCLLASTPLDIQESPYAAFHNHSSSISVSPSFSSAYSGSFFDNSSLGSDSAPSAPPFEEILPPNL